MYTPWALCDGITKNALLQNCITLTPSTLRGNVMWRDFTSLHFTVVVMGCGESSVLCCSVLLCFVLFCSVLLCSVLLCYVMLCYVLFCSVLFCYVMFCFVLFCSVLLCYVLFCYVLFLSVLFCSVLFCYVMFCFVMFCSCLFCYVLFCSVLFCYALFCSRLSLPTAGSNPPPVLQLSLHFAILTILLPVVPLCHYHFNYSLCPIMCAICEQPGREAGWNYLCHCPPPPHPHLAAFPPPSLDPVPSDLYYSSPLPATL